MGEMIYPSLSDEEFNRRYEAVWERMEARGLDVLLVYGDSSGVFANFANCTYLTGYQDRLFSYAVMPRGEEPMLFISNPLYLPTAYAMARVSSVDHATWDPGGRIAEALKGLGLSTGRAGLVGTAGIQKSTMPYEHMQTLTSDLPGVSWEDATDILQEVRRIKSAEEVECLRKGARMTDATLVALKADGRAGMADCELAGIIAHAGLAHGGDQRTLFVGSTSMAEPDLLFPRQTPSQRVTRSGDVFLTELSTEYAGYSGQVHRPFVIDGDPTPEYEQIFEVARATYEAVLAALGPGRTDEDVRRAAGPVVKEAGMWTMDATLHGWGLALEPPRLDVPEVTTIQRPQEPTVFEPGMAVVLQPHILSADRRRGLQVGSLVVITDDGAEALQQYPLEFGRISA